MSDDDYQARHDASLAQHQRQTPRAFGRWLAKLTGAERQAAQERLTRGQAWLARNEGRKDGAQ
jgi:hypothetical protein